MCPPRWIVLHALGDADVTVGNDEIERLQSRVDRERRARRQAEIIAERGMRELWEANHELQHRVTTRTAELMTTIAALERQQLARSIAIDSAMAALSEQLDTLVGDRDQSDQRSSTGEADLDIRQTLGYIRALLAAAPIGPTSTDPIDRDLPGFADALLARWQRPAARAGKLLSVEVGDDVGRDGVDWAVLQAASDTLLRAGVRREATGGLHVLLSGSADGAKFAISGSGWSLDPELVEMAIASPTAWPAVGPGCEELAVAHAIIEAVGGRLWVESDDAMTSVSVVVPSVPSSSGSCSTSRRPGSWTCGRRSLRSGRVAVACGSSHELISWRSLLRLTGAASPRVQ